MNKLVASMSMLSLLATVGTVFGGECINDRWQPTFVRHHAVAPFLYYFTGTSFVPVADPDEAQDMCLAHGVRDPVEGEACDERPWSDFLCACNVEPPENRTCAAFQEFVKEERDQRPVVRVVAGR